MILSWNRSYKEGDIGSLASEFVDDLLDAGEDAATLY